MIKKGSNKDNIIKAVSKFDFAHRGLHQKPEIGENSPTAFRRAVEKGYAIELDVHLTLDKKLAVIHDSNLKRTCGVDLEIEKITLDEAKKYPLEASNDRISEFSEFLDIVSGKVPILVELKAVGGNAAELTDRVMEDLKDYDGLYVLESFFPGVIRHLMKNYPDVVRGQLAGKCGKETDISWIEDFCLSNLVVNLIGHPDFVAYRFEDRSNFFFRAYRGPKFFWTLRNFEDFKIAHELGATPIFEKFDPKELGYENK